MTAESKIGQILGLAKECWSDSRSWNDHSLLQPGSGEGVLVWFCPPDGPAGRHPDNVRFAAMRTVTRAGDRRAGSGLGVLMVMRRKIAAVVEGMEIEK